MRVPVYTGHIFEGNFGAFGLPKPSFVYTGDPQLGLAIVKDTFLATACPETRGSKALAGPVTTACPEVMGSKAMVHYRLCSNWPGYRGE